MNHGTVCARRRNRLGGKHEHIYIETDTHACTQALACVILLESVFLTLSVLVEYQVHIYNNGHVQKLKLKLTSDYVFQADI